MSSNPIVVRGSIQQPTVVYATPTDEVGGNSTHAYAAPLLDSWSSSGVTQGYDQYDARRKKRKQIITGVCCLCCTLFLLLFFLIPRQPTMALQSSVLAVTSSYTLVQTWTVNNRNPYGVILNNVNTRVDGPILTPGAYYGQEVVGFGLINNDPSSSVSIGSMSSIDVQIYYNMTSTYPGTVAASARQCCNAYSPYVTTGTFDFSTSIALHNYKDISVGQTTVLLCCCSCPPPS